MKILFEIDSKSIAEISEALDTLNFLKSKLDLENVERLVSVKETALEKRVKKVKVKSTSGNKGKQPFLYELRKEVIGQDIEHLGTGLTRKDIAEIIGTSVQNLCIQLSKGITRFTDYENPSCSKYLVTKIH